MKFKDFQAPVLFSSTFKDAWESCRPLQKEHCILSGPSDADLSLWFYAQCTDAGCYAVL